ncbi:MAG TPA: phosphodiester glycosidase family protein [Solirubrobacteraceae bacterium]|nr:phosphodiester glycosidase family protein [Solirubrobacteraceae bacterium]
MPKRAVALVVALFAVLPAGAQARDGLPLGHAGLDERRSTDRLAPGVSYTRIVRGHLSPSDGWAVDVAVVADRAGAEETASRLRAAGFESELTALPRPPDDRSRGPLGYLVRSGRFASRPEADARVAAIRAAGLPARGAVFTAEDGGPTSGPWVVHVLAVDPAHAEPVLANDVVVDRERLSAISARRGAIAAINGGYFVIGDADGTPGDLAGSSILNGRLVSEAVDGRTDLLLRRHRAAVSALWDHRWVEASDGTQRLLDGENRRPGLIRACGGEGGDAPTGLPLHDITCTDPSELIHTTPLFGAATEAGPGAEAVLDDRGRVAQVREPRGGAVPTGGSVLTGTGDAADWLRRHAHPGTRLRVRTRLRDERGRVLPVPGLDVVNGGPRLLRRGRVDITAHAEGFDHATDPGFYYAFGLRRNPRTIAGVTRDGRLLLVAVDGRAPGYSAGLDFEEEALVLRALGAVDGVNLDGGGSTTMTVRGNVVTRPSDATGERPIADALIVAQRRTR